MSKEKYLKIRSGMHSYSRATIAEGQTNLDQAILRSGHYVSSNDVRVADIPTISSIEERDEKFLATDSTTGKRVVGGENGESFKNVIKFIDREAMIAVPNSNRESYFLEDENNEQVINWISPADKLKGTSLKTVSDGYEIKIFTKNASTDAFVEIQQNYGWTFDAFNGVIHFPNSFKPGSDEWIMKGFSGVYIEGFIYIGETLQSSISNISDSANASLAIQPFDFSTEIMRKIEDGLKPTGIHGKWTQTYSIIIPGHCFEVRSLDKDENIIADMRHYANGDTEIFLDLPYDVNHEQPILKFVKNENGITFPVIGHYKFQAFAFVAADGSRIPLRESIDIANCPYYEPQAEYTTSMPEETVSNYPVGVYDNCFQTPTNINLDTDL